MAALTIKDSVVYVDSAGKQKRADVLVTPESEHPHSPRLRGADAEVEVRSPGGRRYRRLVTIQEDGTARTFEPPYEADDEDDYDEDEGF